jgi:hypothetical protein
MDSVSRVYTRQCLQSPQKFCYICGSYVFDSKLHFMDSFVKKLYFSYFHLKVGDQDKCFAPHTACNTCVCRGTALLVWRKTEGNAVCNTHAMAQAEESLPWLLFLYGQRYRLQYEKQKKKKNIRISYQLYGPSLMHLTCQYLVHLITWVTNLKEVPYNRPLEKCISSHINMTDQ